MESAFKLEPRIGCGACVCVCVFLQMGFGCKEKQDEQATQTNSTWHESPAAAQKNPFAFSHMTHADLRS